MRQKTLKIPYALVSGTGNRCLVVESEHFPQASDLKNNAIRQIADPKFGVGTDQILEVTQRNPLHFEVWNRDGSHAGMCGNGARALMKFACVEKWLEHQAQEIFVSGNRCLTLPEVAPNFAIGLELEKCLPMQTVEVDGEKIPFFFVEVGNAHAVVFCGQAAGEWERPKDFEISKWGPSIGQAIDLSEDINIEFVELRADSVASEARVWEVGAGETLSCGSGAVAIAVATKAKLRSRLTKFQISMPGGELGVEFTKDALFLSGPCLIEKSGEFNFEISAE